MAELLQKVEQVIKSHQLIQPGEGLVIAVSGGPDSMALLHLMVALRPTWDLRLVVAHLNHGLRGEEAEQEAAFVADISRQWSVPVEIYQRKVGQHAQKWRCSIQEAGRRVRYEILKETAIKYGCQRIALAHHAQDQAETILENILRGSGAKGLGAMYFRREKIIRPLLQVRRPEIEAYLAEHKVPFCLDPSNLKTIYLRNRLRLELIPHLEEKYNPNLVSALNRMGEIMRAENDLLAELTQAAVKRCLADQVLIATDPAQELNLPRSKGGLNIIIPALLAEPLALQRRVIRQLLEERLGNVREFTYQHIESILELAVNPAGGRKIYLPGNLQARRAKKWLIIETRFVRRKKKGTNFK